MPQALPPASAPASSDLNVLVYAKRETVTATATLKVTTNPNVSVSVSEEASNGPSPCALDSVHRADHETGDALNVWVSSRQKFHQHVRSCNVYSPPPAVP